MTSNPQIKTEVYKTVGDINLTIDVHLPQTFDPENGAVLVHFHGGYLVFGEKTSFPPNWLINACLQRGWAYATPSYRLLPEATAADAVQDVVDATIWLSKHVAKSGRLVVAGSSAGGYLALATAAHPETPPLTAVLCIYGMLDPAAQRYVRPGQPLESPVENLDSVVKAVYEAKERSTPIDGYSFAGDPATDTRYIWMKAMHEAGIYPDIMTGIRGLSQQIDQSGTGVIPERFRFLFPATFGLHAKIPPTALLHGDADAPVDPELSKRVARNLQALGVETLMEVVPGQGHGFDARGLPEGVDIHRDHAASEFIPSLVRVFDFIERLVRDS